MSFILEITKNGKDTILFNNHKYREAYSVKNGDVVWRCLGKSCKATIKTNKEKSAIFFANETHGGKHPVTMRALTPTPLHKRQRLSFTTPASVSESSSHTPITMSTPDPPTTTDTSTPALPSGNSQDNTPPTFSALQEENTALKEELARVREERQIILDHSAESDLRLIQFTDTIFMSPTAATVTKEARSHNNKAKQAKDVGLQDSELSKLRNKIEELKETIQILKRPCESCNIFKEETSNMINSLRCLEEENNLLKKKLCSESLNSNKKLTFQTVLKNSFEVLGEEEEDIGVTKDDTSYITVQNKRKRSKKKQKTKSNKNKMVLKHPNKTRDKNDKCSHIPFKNVTVIGDSHVRNLATLIRERTKIGTSISGVCKPGAGLLSVKPTTKPPRDHCYVLMAGTNDVDVGREDVIFGHLEEVLHTCKISSKVLVLTLPARHDLPPDSPVHNTVRMVNNYISELCLRHQGVDMLDVSSIDRRHFTAHGIHFGQSGKRLLASRIVERMANMQPQPRHPQVAPTPSPVSVAPETGTQPAQPHTLPFETFADALKSSKHHETGPQMENPCSFLGTSISRVEQN